MDGVGWGEVARLPLIGIEPKLVNVSIVRTDDVGIPAITNHQRGGALRTGLRQGIVENASVGLLDACILRENHLIEVRCQP